VTPAVGGSTMIGGCVGVGVGVGVGDALSSLCGDPSGAGLSPIAGAALPIGAGDGDADAAGDEAADGEGGAGVAVGATLGSVCADAPPPATRNAKARAPKRRARKRPAARGTPRSMTLLRTF